MIKKIFSLLLGDILYGMSSLMPKNDKIWIFGAWFGEKYTDNSKYLYEYINKNHKNIRAIWLTKNKDTLRMIQNKGYETYYMYSLTGIFLSMKAKVGIISTSSKDINHYCSCNMKFIQLWHGIPLKKIVYDDVITCNYPNKAKRAIMKLFPFSIEDYNKMLIISTSPEVSKTLTSAFRVTASNVVVTGYPRNDAFFIANSNVPIIKKINNLKKNSFKIGIYMPTHRQEGKINIFELFSGNIDKINDYLKGINTILLIKFHFYHLKEIKNINKLSNIIFINDNDIDQDIYSILRQTDFLITDYSSIFFDYLLLDKPIIFAPFDQEDYLKNDREFYYNYELVTPGIKAKDWDEVLERVKNLIYCDNYTYNEERAFIKKMFHTFSDGNSSERVFQAIKIFSK